MAWKMARKVRKIPDVSMGVEKKVGRLITFRLSCNVEETCPPSVSRNLPQHEHAARMLLGLLPCQLEPVRQVRQRR